MKVKKKRKKYILQIALACLLICSVVQWMPETAQASQISLERYVHCTPDIDPSGWLREQVYNLQCTNSDLRVYCTYRTDYGSYDLWFVSKQPLTIKYTGVTYKGETYNNTFSSSSSYTTSSGSGSYHYYKFGFGYPAGLYKFKANGIASSFYYSGDRSEEDLLKVIFRESDGDWFTWTESDNTEDIDNEASKGMLDNPIEDDEEIGIPIITKRRYTTVYHDTDMGNASDGKEDIDDSQFIFDWSNKTSTGFNLKKNKYHMTRIQIKVQSKCVVYSGFSHKTVKKRFDNYGEMSSEIKSALVDDTPYSIEYGTVKSMLPKTFSEKHNPLYVGRNFTFYFRVMCNESASGTGKWHCGAWRAVGLNASTTQDQTDESSNGHIDSDGNYTKDPDDGHNNSDSDSSTVDDKEDAKDQFKDDQKNNVTNGKNDSSGFEWSDLKKLVNECKEVPALIKSIFSFLPDWVLVFVAVGFGIWIFVLIKRAIV